MPKAPTNSPRRGKRSALLSAAEIADFFQILSTHIVPKGELHYTTPLDLLIAVVLSAQSTDKAVNRVTAELWQYCRNAEDYLDWGQERLEDSLRSIGLFRAKAKAIIGICRLLLERHGGEVPRTREELMALPGVGRKTANVVLNVAFGEPVLAVDTHIFRVANRCGLVKAATPEATELALLPRIPPEHLKNAHHYLLLHGRYTCKARKPECDNCPVATLCRSRATVPAKQPHS
ncbi:MAG: endonuclease III [Lentisphaeria bacterium]|jgi:endonuclease-3